ncbi:MAG: hypothetical protein AB7S26_29425 [Sandaracinaceae bacterium]
MADVVIYAVLGYLGLGALFALPFAFVLAPRTVGGAAGTSIAFRALIVPGCVVLWPLVVWRWLALRREGAASSEPTS